MQKNPTKQTNKQSKKSEVTLGGPQACGYQGLREETPELTDTAEITLLANSLRTELMKLLLLPSLPW